MDDQDDARRLDRAIEEAWGTAQAARAILDEEGLVTKSPRGHHKHPAFQMWRDSLDLWRRLKAQRDGIGDDLLAGAIREFEGASG